MSKKLIAVDFDDVLFPFTHKFQDYVVEKYGLKPIPKHQIKSPLFVDVFENETNSISSVSSQYKAQQIYDELIESEIQWNKFHILTEEEEKDMKKIYSQLLLLKDTHEFVIVTARSEIHNFKIITNYCNRYFPDIFIDFHFCNSYSNTGIKRTKAEICLQYKISVLVDDSLHNVKEVQMNSIRGIPFGKHSWSQHETNVSTWEALVVLLLKN